MEPLAKKVVKILCMSDTHGQIDKIDLSQQEGDIFIFGGDFTLYCNQDDIHSFLDYIDKLKFKHKIVICGNHEVLFDRNLDKKVKSRWATANNRVAEELVSLLRKHCIYLEHEAVEVEGIRIFGSPYTFRQGTTGFCYQKEQANKIWDQIPKVDILLTHGPPYEIADIGKQHKRYGCPTLLQKVMKLKPKYHIFGHVHESGGQQVIKEGITFVNISQCGAGRVLTWKPYKFIIEVDPQAGKKDLDKRLQ